MNTIKVIRGSLSNQYCVPAALSALTGLSVDEIIPLVREHLGDQAISGLFLPIAIRILRDKGYTIRSLTLDCTVNQLPRLVKGIHPYLIEIHRHALVYHNGLIIDNRFPDGILIKNYPAKAFTIHQCYEVAASQAQ